MANIAKPIRKIIKKLLTEKRHEPEKNLERLKQQKHPLYVQEHVENRIKATKYAKKENLKTMHTNLKIHAKNGLIGNYKYISKRRAD